MRRILAVCQGISPYLMNPVTDDVLEQVRTGVHRTKDKTASVEDVAREKLCMDSGALGFPAVNLCSSLVVAGRRVKIGKSQVSTATSTTLYGFLAVEEFFVPFTGNPRWLVDKRRGVNPNGGEMVCLIRPRFDKWGFQVHLQLDETECDIGTAQNLLRISGSFVGLGDFRPGKRGPFGRFRISKWKDLGPVEDI